MSELDTAFVVHGTRHAPGACTPTRHTHSTRLFRLSRPGAVGTLELLPGESRTTVVWRST